MRTNKFITFIKSFKKKLALGFVFICFLTMSGRSFYIKKYIIDEEKLGNILTYFYILSESKNTNFNSKIDLQDSYASILSSFNVTSSQFIKSIRYYDKNIKKLESIYKNSLDEALLLKAKN